MIANQLFGRTRHESTRTIFGAAALSKVTQDEADQTLEILLRYGVNHIDAAAGYGDAELRIAPWLQKHRGRFFLATKTGGRTYDDAKRDIHNSLERMGVERVDLIELHSLADPIEWDIALSPKGALDACVEAREQGLVRFIGVTGHGNQIAATHLRSLERFDFDTVLLPYSYIVMQDAHYAAAFDRLVAVCSERNVAVQTIKSIARRPWWGRDHTRANGINRRGPGRYRYRCTGSSRVPGSSYQLWATFIFSRRCSTLPAVSPRRRTRRRCASRAHGSR